MISLPQRVGVVEKAPLGDRRADVRSGKTSEARPRWTAETVQRGSEALKFLFGGWGEPQPFYR